MPGVISRMPACQLLTLWRDKRNKKHRKQNNESVVIWPQSYIKEVKRQKQNKTKQNIVICINRQKYAEGNTVFPWLVSSLEKYPPSNSFPTFFPKYGQNHYWHKILKAFNNFWRCQKIYFSRILFKEIC